MLTWIDLRKRSRPVIGFRTPRVNRSHAKLMKLRRKNLKRAKQCAITVTFLNLSFFSKATIKTTRLKPVAKKKIVPISLAEDGDKTFRGGGSACVRSLRRVARLNASRRALRIRVRFVARVSGLFLFSLVLRRTKAPYRHQLPQKLQKKKKRQRIVVYALYRVPPPGKKRIQQKKNKKLSPRTTRRGALVGSSSTFALFL